MNTTYSWKETEQIDPSFARESGDFVVVPVSDQATSTQESKIEVSSTAPVVSPMPDLSGIADSPPDDKRRQKLSTTKRAAQNRNAQKAFRLRREKYVKELESTASEVAQLHKTIEELRQENLQLRDYTLALQSRLIELSPNVAVNPHQLLEFNKMV